MESWEIALGALVKDASLHGPNGKQKRVDVEISEGRGPEVMKLLNDNVLHTESWQVNYRWSYCAGRKDMIKIMNLTIDEAVKLRVSDRSARDIFWASMEPIAGKTKDATYAQFVSNHRWVSDYIAKYEKKYGFGFGDVLPVDNSDVYMWIAVGTLAVVAAILIIKKYRK